LYRKFLIALAPSFSASAISIRAVPLNLTARCRDSSWEIARPRPSTRLALDIAESTCPDITGAAEERADHAGLKKAIAEVVNLWASLVERTLQVEIK
jgi:hypothetical protein